MNNAGKKNQNTESSLNKISFFTDLNAWKEGHKLVLLIYKLTKNFPSDEKFALIDQMRRAVISVTSNIALGSVTEIQNQLFTSRDIGYLSQVDFQKTLDQSIITHKITNGLIKSCKGFINHNS